MADSALYEEQSESSQMFGPRYGMNNEEEPDRAALARECWDYFVYYQSKLVTPFNNMVRWNKLFLNEVKDRRRADENWRAFVPTPYAWSTIKTMAATYNDLIFGQSPIIKPHAISSKNEMSAQNIERLFSFVFRRINFQSSLKRAIEEMGIQGVSVRKNTLIERNIRTFVFPDEKKEAAFSEAIANALAQNVEVPDLNNKAEFERWRLLANEELGLGIPEAPIPGPRTIRQYHGPGFLDLSIFDMLFDPNINDPMDQPMVIQRSLKPLAWLLDRTGPEDDKIFDPVAVKAARANAADTQSTNEYHQEIMDSYGLTTDGATNPYMKNAVEIWECWFPGARKFNYRIVLNRNQVINKNMSNPYPFPHPYIFLRNNTVSGNALGISELKVVERLLYEMNTLRSLRLDALLLSTLPMFVRPKDGKMSQRESFIRPGRVISSSNPALFRQIVQMGLDPSVFKEDSEIKNDINEATGTLPVARGATAAPRVTTSNVDKAFQATFTRVKDRLLEFEGELQPFVTNSLAIFYTFWDTEKIVRVGGDPRMNPFVTYSRDNFLEALESDYAFQGARTAFDQDSLIQNAKELFTIFGGVAEGLPTLKLDAMAQQLAQLVLKDRADAIFMSEEELAEVQQAQQEEEAAAQAEAGPAPAPPPEGEQPQGG